jgi:phosphopantothenoylcysteine synthetase/decarboxylase
MEFVKNQDIAFEFGKQKGREQITVGFALETEKLLENGQKNDE